MTDYPKMYSILCIAASEAIDMPPEEAKRILRQALEEAEEVFIRTCEVDEVL